MRQVFADTFYWAALINPRDNKHLEVSEFSQTLAGFRLVTTEEVLLEVLNFFSEYNTFVKRRVSQFVHDIIDDPDTVVVEQSHASFQAGFVLYEQRLDKGYSLTDCISMQTMKQLGITEVLTRDCHFAQEGFTILFAPT